MPSCIMSANENDNTNRFLFRMRTTENSISPLALQTQFSKTFSSEKTFAVLPKAKTLCCALWKIPFLVRRRSDGIFATVGLTYRAMVGLSSSLGSDVLSCAALRYHFAAAYLQESDLFRGFQSQTPSQLQEQFPN